MPEPTKIWTAPVAARQDPSAPITTSWGNDTWDNLQFLMEWLGNDYLPAAAQNHNHDGVNSAKVNIFPGLIPNGSFEEISNGLPISWSVTEYTGGTVATTTTTRQHGERSLVITSTVLANGGGEAIHDEFKPVSENRYYGAEFNRFASVADVSCRVELIWYNASKAQISATTLIDDSNTPITPTLYSDRVLSPTNARYARTRVIGGVPGVGSAVGSVYFDAGRAVDPLPDNFVAQNNIVGGAVGVSQLKSTVGLLSTTSTTPVDYVLPGGAFGFYPRVYSSLINYAYWGWDAAGGIAVHTGLKQGSGASAAFTLASSSPLYTAYASQYYIQSSPPYNLGDGDIPLFIFLEIEKSTRKIVSCYAAPEAPWHNNGPTNIRPTYYNQNGEGFLKRKDMQHVPFTFEEAQQDNVQLKEYMSEFIAANDIFIPITQDIKQADMPLIPRPMEPAKDGSTEVVMLDPVSALGLKLFEMKEHDNVNIPELFHSGHLSVDNIPLSRSGPPGVDVVGYKWK